MRPAIILSAGLALAALSACDRPDADTDVTGAPAARPAAVTADAALRPGLWSMTASADGEQSQQREFCITPETASLQSLVAHEYEANPDCVSQPRPTGPGTLAVVFVCRGEEGEVRADVTGSHTAETFETIMVLTVDGGGQTNGMTIKGSGRRIGDACPAVTEN